MGGSLYHPLYIPVGIPSSRASMSRLVFFVLGHTRVDCWSADRHLRRLRHAPFSSADAPVFPTHSAHLRRPCLLCGVCCHFFCSPSLQRGRYLPRLSIPSFSNFLSLCVYACGGCFARPQEGKYMRKMRAQDLWFAILDAQTETGNPYMMFKVGPFFPSCQRVCSCRCRMLRVDLGTVVP